MQNINQQEPTRTKQNMTGKRNSQNRINTSMTYADALKLMAEHEGMVRRDVFMFINRIEMETGNGKFLMFHLDAMGIYGKDILDVYAKYAHEDLGRFVRLIFDRSPSVYEVL